MYDIIRRVFPRGQLVNIPPANARDAGDVDSISLDQEDTLEKEMTTSSSILAWKIP